MTGRDRRAAELLEATLHERRARVDRIMRAILIGQWIVAIVLALIRSPYAWAGGTRHVHPHVYLAVFLGLALEALPLLLIHTRPGSRLTRHVVTVAQMAWSALLIHLSGGRIETHFHVFVSFAILAFYCDVSVLVVGTLMVVADHLLRGLFLPASVYGTSNPEWWRFMEHGAWVMFEDLVLYFMVHRALQFAREGVQRQAELEELNATLELKVEERTCELRTSNLMLKESYDDLQGAQQQLMVASRQAGMAEIASSVLHNIGNVLNSVNVSSTLLTDTVRSSAIKGVSDLVELIQKHESDLDGFLDRQGQRVVAYLRHISLQTGDERTRILGELASLQASVDHIKSIVAAQQTAARSRGVIEQVQVATVIEAAIGMSGVERAAGIEVLRDLAPVPQLSMDRHKLLQILVNLLSNGRDALFARGDGPLRLTVRLAATPNAVHITVEDNGCGIAAADLPKLFRIGHTTKKNGHGFGLHSSACFAAELRATLDAESDGPGHGARFTLRLPREAVAAAA